MYFYYPVYFQEHNNTSTKVWIIIYVFWLAIQHRHLVMEIEWKFTSPLYAARVNHNAQLYLQLSVTRSSNATATANLTCKLYSTIFIIWRINLQSYKRTIAYLYIWRPFWTHVLPTQILIWRKNVFKFILEINIER